MKIFPHYYETLVLPFSSNKVKQILIDNTLVPGDNKNSEKKFAGHIEADNFRISEKLNRPDNFIPLIRGSVENTSKGSIIFTSYNLLFSTALFVAFWSFVTLMLSIIFLFKYNQPVYSAIALFAFLFNYLFTSANFHRKVKGARETFYSLFTS